MSRHASASSRDACPCGSGRDYQHCCEPLHRGAPAVDAEALMRSRYCAYVLADAAYLLASWHPTTRPERLELQGDATRWLGLEVKCHVPDGDSAEVEFVARCRVGGGSAQRLHERSRFRREHGHWYYLDAIAPTP